MTVAHDMRAREAAKARGEAHSEAEALRRAGRGTEFGRGDPGWCDGDNGYRREGGGGIAGAVRTARETIPHFWWLMTFSSLSRA